MNNICIGCQYRAQQTIFDVDGPRFKVTITCEHNEICKRAYYESMKRNMNIGLLECKIEDLIADAEIQKRLNIEIMLKRLKNIGCKNLKDILDELNIEINRYRTQICEMEATLKRELDDEHN